ncbi:HGGxSTG domain-containing protein [Bradyrhizobium diazoefficiens]|uniref:HGGxSTG domain-containing protein n=2 Tax=Nitrobacteraceae TaxID=41294 RepID=UPI00272A4A2E|nr:HGGxSTG domain-containing protein [Bradyrhizobium diazoefficiens]WLA61119.1 HGGxSTG domain-containing protein [Bradyrhizobium diazoefficiens]
MRSSPRCGARTRDGDACRAPAAHGKMRCRMHGGARRSGAPRDNENARTHGLFAKEAIAERRQIQLLLAEGRKLLKDLSGQS